MAKEFGIEYKELKLKMPIKLAGRYFADIDKLSLSGTDITYKIIAKPYGVALHASWGNGGNVEYLIPYENIKYLIS